MTETGLAVVLSLGNYKGDKNSKQFNDKVNLLIDTHSSIWGPKNMDYKLVLNAQKTAYLSLNSLLDFIKETRFNINSEPYDYLIINIIGKGNNKYLITSDNETISWLKIYELFSFAKQFFIPTVFCIDVLNENGNNNKFESDDADYESLNVFGYSSTQIEYFGFITNALYQRKNAVHLSDVIRHIMIWNKYIFTVPKEIDWDEDDHDIDFKQREAKNEIEDTESAPPPIFEQKKKTVSNTVKGGRNWNITYSIDRRAWGPFLSKYDYSAFVHDQGNNRKDIQSIILQIERPIGVKKESKFKKILQNGSFINQTLRQEGSDAVGNTSLSVKVITHTNKIIVTSKISIN